MIIHEKGREESRGRRKWEMLGGGCKVVNKTIEVGFNVIC